MKVFLAVIFSLNASAVFAAAFDCSKAKLETEKLICSDKDVSSYDYEMAYYYSFLSSRIQDREKLKKEQLIWLQERNRCESANCLLEAYHGRIDELKRYVNAIIGPRGNPEIYSYVDISEKSKTYGCMKLWKAYPYVYAEIKIYSPTDGKLLLIEMPSVIEYNGTSEFYFVDQMKNQSKAKLVFENIDIKVSLKISQKSFSSRSDNYVLYRDYQFNRDSCDSFSKNA